MLTTWFLAPDDAFLEERFQLRFARDGRDPFTLERMKLVGPAPKPLHSTEWLPDVAWFQLDALELEAVAGLFEVDALEEIDRTRIEEGSAHANVHLSHLPALYRVPAEAVAAFKKKAGGDRARWVKSFARRLKKEGWIAGFELAVSDSFPERFRAWQVEASPDAEAELIEAFVMLLESAPRGATIVGLAEET